MANAIKASADMEKAMEQRRREVVRALQTEDVGRLRQVLRSDDAEALVAEPVDSKGNFTLHLAVLNGFEEGVDLLLADPRVDVNSLTEWRETPLHLAVENEFNTIVQGLLATGRCHLDIASKRRSETVLHVAARVGNTFAAKELLDHSFNVHGTDVDGNTALHLAVMKRRGEITRLLLVAGLDHKAKNSQQKSPLFIAMRDLNDQRLTEILVRVKRPAVPKEPARRAPASHPKFSRGGRRGAPSRPAVVPCKPEQGIFQTEVVLDEVKRREGSPAGQGKQEVPRPLSDSEIEKARKDLKSAGVQACLEEDQDEAPAPVSSRDFYKMDDNPRGICLIFNNETYWHENFQERSGADIDENRLNSLFRRLNFKVKIHKNLNAAEMFWEVMNIARHTDHSAYDCFVCCILSHGALGTIYGVDGDSFRISELTIALTARRCPSLAGKPKMFFIQACRGEEVQGLLDQEHSHDAQLGSEPARLVPDHADFLLSYATVAGFRAQRHKQNGSLYVQNLCNNIHALHKRQDLLSILTKVNAETAAQIFETPCGAKFKQMPEVRHTLTKAILFG